MTGNDVYMLVIVGAMMGALLTTSQLPDGVSIPQGFTAAAKARGRKGNDVIEASHEIGLGPRIKQFQN